MITIYTVGIRRRTFSFMHTRKDQISNGRDLLDLSDSQCAAVHIALKKPNYEMFELLLENSADICVQNKYGNNIIHIAAANNDITALEIILRTQQAKQELGSRKLGAASIAKNKKEKTPTELANNKKIMEV